MATKTKTQDTTTDAARAWTILASLKRPFNNRDSIWPVRRRVRLRLEDVPLPEAYAGTAMRHKALALDTPIATPEGWTTMGDIRVGDEVFDEEGRPTLVLAATAVMQGHEVYAVTLSDGTVIRADAGHYWSVRDIEDRRRNRPARVLSTEEMLDRGLQASNGVRCKSRFSIDNALPLQLPAQPLSVDPYLLGLWLGDGAEAWGKMAIAEPELVEAFATAGYQPHQSRRNPYGYSTSGFGPELKALGVIGNKHIPAAYLRASFDQRLALLQGLMDSDGTCSVRGECKFEQTREFLARQTEELLASLGIKFTTVVCFDNRKETYKDTYRTQFFSSLPVFRLERKLCRQRRSLVKSQRRFVTRIELLPSEPVRCIAVAAPSHLFLAGRNMVPTCNSAELDWAVRQIVSLLGENREQYIVYAPDETQAMQRKADETQKAVSALMQMLDERHPIERPRQLCHDYQVADGVAVEKITFPQEYFDLVRKSKGDKGWRDAFAEYVRKEKELPLRKHAIDPFTLYWEFDINGLAAVAEHSRARKTALTEEYAENQNVLDAIARLPVGEGYGPGASTYGNSTTPSVGSGSNSTFDDSADSLTVLEVWTRKDFFLVAESGGVQEILVRQKHSFKRPPYFFAPGILTGSQDPLHQFQPLVLPMYPLALELSAVRTARLNAAFLSSFKPFYVKYNAGVSEDEEAGNVKIHFLMPGANIPSIKGGEIVPIQWTNLEELEKMEQTLMADRERFGFQAILAGNVQASGESTAWATRMMRDQGMVQFNGVLRNYAQMRADEVRFIMDFVRDVLKTDLPVSRRIEGERGKKNGRVETIYLTQEMCSSGFEVQCRLTAGKASDRISIVEEFRRAHEAGEVPMRMVREEAWQFENASEIGDEVLDEQIRQQLLPKAMEQIMAMAFAGAEEELALPQNMSPEQAAADAQAQADAQMQQEQEMAAQAAAMQAGGTTPLPQNNPISGEMPAGAAEAGLGQGLTVPEIPPDEQQGVLLQ